MAEPIIVKPQEQSPVVVEGNASKTPIKVTTDMDYSHVAEMIDEKIGDIDFSTIAKEQTLLDKAEEIVTEVQKVNDAQEIIDQMVAIQLQTIIGNENIE